MEGRGSPRETLPAPAPRPQRRPRRSPISAPQLVQRIAESRPASASGTSPSSEKSSRASDLRAQIDQHGPPGLRPLSQRTPRLRQAPGAAASRFPPRSGPQGPRRSVRSSLPLLKARRMNSPGSGEPQRLVPPATSKSACRTARLAMQLQLGHVLAGLARRRRETTATSPRSITSPSDGRRSVRSSACRGSGRRAAQCRKQPARRRARICGRPRRRRERRRSTARIWYPSAHFRTRSTMNRLAGSTSPYLRQHADNPGRLVAVDTRGFRGGEAAQRPDPSLDRLRRLPLVPCHGARELLRRRQSPTLLNENFVCIKVDREERPEVDQIYMRALHALGEQGGWPLTMFLTPDAEPFWGGTYFPPEPRWGRPELPRRSCRPCRPPGRRRTRR